MDWTLICAVNSDRVLNSCLLSSADAGRASEIILQRGYASAGAAYNSAIDRARTDLLVMLHQDMYLPEGWAANLQSGVEFLSDADPAWGVLGAWGVSGSGEGAGHVYCTATIRMLGRAFRGARAVRTLDEVMLIIRKSSGLQFDERVPGFHMYGTDLCLEAERRRMKCYAISAFCIHNSNAYRVLPWEFWKSYLFIRRKWKTVLPVHAPCAPVVASYWPLIRSNVVQRANLLLRRHKHGRRVDDPARLYRELAEAGMIQSAFSSKPV